MSNALSRPGLHQMPVPALFSWEIIYHRSLSSFSLVFNDLSHKLLLFVTDRPGTPAIWPMFDAPLDFHTFTSCVSFWRARLCQNYLRPLRTETLVFGQYPAPHVKDTKSTDMCNPLLPKHPMIMGVFLTSTSQWVPSSFNKCWVYHSLANGCPYCWHTQWNGFQSFSISLALDVWCSFYSHYRQKCTIPI